MNRSSHALVYCWVALTCACEHGADPEPGRPSVPPSIRGRITAIAEQSLLVEANPAQTSGSPKAYVRWTPQTVVVRRDGSPTNVAELRVGQIVRVWFVGPVAESYPLQATAGKIVIEEGDIVRVEERHEARSMAIPGVVGVGIGHHQGRVCILVMVEASTPQITRQIPATLDGFSVAIEVTGPIVAH